MKPLLYDLTLDQLADWLHSQGQQRFRARQVFEWAYQKSAPGFDAMSSLPKDLREVLAACFDMGPIPAAQTSGSNEVSKLLLPMPAGGQVECVRIDMGTTITACVSCQVGCAVGCAFCATGQMRCERNLGAGEIVAQLVTIRAMGGQVSNVVFMGMGEPFHNYDAVLEAVRLFTDKQAFGMSPSRVTVSTSGVVPGIRKYAKEGLATELAVSLNAPTDALRKQLMPGVAKWSIRELVDACGEFSKAHGGQPVTFAYVLIEGVNDSLDHARELTQLLRRRPHHVNLIPLNPVSHCDLRGPNRQRTKAFLHHCRHAGLNVSLRRSKGADVDAACGQLRTRSEKPQDEG